MICMLHTQSPRYDAVQLSQLITNSNIPSLHGQSWRSHFDDFGFDFTSDSSSGVRMIASRSFERLYLSTQIFERTHPSPRLASPRPLAVFVLEESEACYF